MGIEAILSDLDGVVINSRDANRELIYYIAEYHGLKQPTIQETDAVFNLPLVEGLVQLFRISEEEARRMSEATQSGFERVLPLMKTDPILTNVLQQLRRYKLGIVTGRGVTIYRILHHFKLTGYFDIIVDRTQYKKPKPHPESLQLAIKTLGVNPWETVYVGDGDVDVEAAVAANVVPIYFGATNHPKARYNVRNLERLGYLLLNLF